MQIISLILSGLALLAAIVSLVLTIKEKKRSQKRNATLTDYVYKECEAMSIKSKNQGEVLASALERIQKLESGITPDYEQAKAAVNAVNDFNRGISNILGFDPMDAVKKRREQERSGGEAE